jgi:5-methyltetrahydropteroyltriglutamate--homocysteine methyltransferase
LTSAKKEERDARAVGQLDAARANAMTRGLLTEPKTAATVPTKPPFRADHVGSLLRPKRVVEARETHAAGRITAAELRRIEDEAVRTLVRMQEDVGLKSATDGEIRRQSWHMDFLYQVGGVTRIHDNLAVKFRNEQGEIEFAPEKLRVVGKLHMPTCIFGEDFKYLQSVVKSATPKLTIPAPSMMHYRAGPAAIDRAVYPDMEEFWDDLAEAYADEIDALGKLGCTYLQIDDTSLAYLNDPRQRRYIDEIGGDGESQHLTYIRAVNRAVARKPAEMTICVHMCRGNYRSCWVAAGGYDYVADAIFNQLEVDGYFLEYDDGRSGGFEPLRFVPKGKQIVLGIVTTKRGTLEKKDDLKRRIDQAAKYVPFEQLCLGPQCGFASTVEGNALTAEEQMAKLRLVVETAREIWGD